MFFNHPGWIETNADHVRTALDQLGRGTDVHLAFTAHSIPVAMARACRYDDQLRESARLVAEAVGVTDTALVYQSRSGPPQVPWLEPDILDHLRAVAARGVTDVVISPIGFVSDHLEVLFDLDVEAVETAAELGLNLVRAASADEVQPELGSGLHGLESRSYSTSRWSRSKPIGSRSPHPRRPSLATSRGYSSMSGSSHGTGPAAPALVDERRGSVLPRLRPSGGRLPQLLVVAGRARHRHRDAVRGEGDGDIRVPPGPGRAPSRMRSALVVDPLGMVEVHPRLHDLRGAGPTSRGALPMSSRYWRQPEYGWYADSHDRQRALDSVTGHLAEGAASKGSQLRFPQ